MIDGGEDALTIVMLLCDGRMFESDDNCEEEDLDTEGSNDENLAYLEGDADGYLIATMAAGSLPDTDVVGTGFGGTSNFSAKPKLTVSLSPSVKSKHSVRPVSGFTALPTS